MGVSREDYIKVEEGSFHWQLVPKRKRKKEPKRRIMKPSTAPWRIHHLYPQESNFFLQSAKLSLKPWPSATFSPLLPSSFVVSKSKVLLSR